MRAARRVREQSGGGPGLIMRAALRRNPVLGEGGPEGAWRVTGPWMTREGRATEKDSHRAGHTEAAPSVMKTVPHLLSPAGRAGRKAHSL